MKFHLSTKSAFAIAASLPAMERNRLKLSSKIGAYISRYAACDADGGQSAGLAITNLLYEHARRFSAEPSTPSARGPGPRLRTLDNLPKRCLSYFGDGLGPVMKDLLHAEASPAVLAAWGDAFWASVRAAADQEQLLAA